jgi:hypothetical protein
MIASPSDVPRERLVVRECIEEWNATYAAKGQLVLLPVAWDTNTAPSMEAPAQDIIDRDVLATADILVGVFWTRLGTPTGKAPSGTVREIQAHIAAGKPAMLYFADTPVELKSVDLEQYQALVDFREDCKRRGLVDTFASIEDFRRKLTRQLAHTVLSKYWSPSSSDSESVSALTPVRAPKLSNEARTLLLEAAHDQHGDILRVRYMGGSHVQTNGKAFGQGGSHREQTSWWSAVDELEGLGLIRDLGYKGEVFELTREGYHIAELIAQE